MFDGEEFRLSPQMVVRHKRPAQQSLGFMQLARLAAGLGVLVFVGYYARSVLAGIAVLVLLVVPVILGTVKPLSAWMVAKLLPGVMREVSIATRKVRAELLKSPRGRVLDVGAGTGEYWRYMDPTSTVVAVEPNPYLRDTLLHKAAKAPCTILVRTGFIGDLLPDEAATFDLVILGNVLCEVPSQDAILAQVDALLKPGGRVFFCEHVAYPRGSWRRILQRAIAPWWARVSDGCHCDRDSLDAIKRQRGWDVMPNTTYELSGGLPWIGRFEIGLAVKRP